MGKERRGREGRRREGEREGGGENWWKRTVDVHFLGTFVGILTRMLDWESRLFWVPAHTCHQCAAFTKESYLMSLSFTLLCGDMNA